MMHADQPVISSIDPWLNRTVSTSFRSLRPEAVVLDFYAKFIMIDLSLCFEWMSSRKKSFKSRNNSLECRMFGWQCCSSRIWMLFFRCVVNRFRFAICCSTSSTSEFLQRNDIIFSIVNRWPLIFLCKQRKKNTFDVNVITSTVMTLLSHSFSGSMKMKVVNCFPSNPLVNQRRLFLYNCI